MQSYKKVKRNLSDENYLEIRYEDLCESPEYILKNAIEFCNLNWSVRLDKKLNKIKLRSKNDKYKNDLTVKQIEMLDSILNKELMLFNYK